MRSRYLSRTRTRTTWSWDEGLFVMRRRPPFAPASLRARPTQREEPHADDEDDRRDRP